VRDSLERTASSMQSMAAAMRGTADSAEAANRLAEDASMTAQQGGDVVHRLVTTLETVRRSTLRLEQLGASIELTLGRAGTLALNAAVEAAQAGEPGEQAVAAACALRGLAREAGAAAAEARAVARQAVATIESGSAWAAQAGSSMADLASSVQEVGDIVNGIGSTCLTRARELAGVNQAIVRMDEMNQQGTRMVEEAAMAARTLQQQALTLSRAVAAFRLDEALQGGLDGASHEKAPQGTPDGRPGGAGHPYLRLASSRGRNQK
jgi:methyl-accepting chemotaxis protein